MELNDYKPKPTPPVPIVLTGDEEWVERTPGISLKEYREWASKMGPVHVITLNPYTGEFKEETRSGG